MKYIPDLIPPQSRVNIDFSKRYSSASAKASDKKSVVYYLRVSAGSLMLLLGVLNITRFMFAIPFFLIGMMLIPDIHENIERTLRFKFIIKLQLIFFVVLLGLGSLSLPGYFKEENRLAAVKKAEEEKARQEEISIRKEKQQRQDSLNFYIQQAKVNQGKKNFLASVSFYTNALKFQENNKEEILFQRGLCFFNSKKYQEAIGDFNAMIEKNPANPEVLYNRAQCLIKLKDIPGAVADLRTAIKLNHFKSDSLHEKINPLLKKVVGTHRICCDGSKSYSSGRGTCSHHGGVCGEGYDYRTYRKY